MFGDGTSEATVSTLWVLCRGLSFGKPWWRLKGMAGSTWAVWYPSNPYIMTWLWFVSKLAITTELDSQSMSIIFTMSIAVWWYLMGIPHLPETAILVKPLSQWLWLSCWIRFPTWRSSAVTCWLQMTGWMRPGEISAGGTRGLQHEGVFPGKKAATSNGDGLKPMISYDFPIFWDEHLLIFRDFEVRRISGFGFIAELMYINPRARR